MDQFKDCAKMLEDAAQNGEPVFILRAKDLLSVPTLDAYIKKAEKAGVDQAFWEELIAIKENFQLWQINNRTRIKLPD